MIGSIICRIHGEEEGLNGMKDVGDEIFLVNLAVSVREAVSEQNFHLFGQPKVIHQKKNSKQLNSSFKIK